MDENTGLSRRQMILAGVGAVGLSGIGFVLRDFFKDQPVKSKEPKAPSEWSFLNKYFSADDQMFLSRFLDLSHDEQNQIVKSLDDLLDVKTGMKMYHQAIIESMPSEVWGYERLQVEAKQSANMAKALEAIDYDLKQHELSVIQRQHVGNIDKIILPNEKPPLQLAVLLTGDWPTSVLAHEGLHSYQYSKFPNYKLRRLINDNPGYHKTRVLDEQGCREIAEQYMKKPEASDTEVRKWAHEALIWNPYRLMLSEMQAFMLTPALSSGSWDFPVNLDLEPWQVTPKQKDLYKSMITATYGCFLNNGPKEEVDIRVALFVGHFNDPKQYLRGLKAMPGAQAGKNNWTQVGEKFLTARAKKISKTKNLTQQYLTKHL